MLKEAIYTLSLLGSIGLSAPAMASVNLEFTAPQAATGTQTKLWRQIDDTIKSVVDTINHEFQIPANIKLVIGGNPKKPKDKYSADKSTYYDPYTQTIAIPHNFVSDVLQFYSANYYGESAQAKAHFVGNAMTHMLYHELGYALIDILDLPIVGNEENIVDGFATLMLISLHQKSHERVVSAADLYWFVEDCHEDIPGQKSSQGNNFNSQRAHQILCLLYGSSPKGYKVLSGDLGVDNKQMASCQTHFLKLQRNWLRLLKPSLKKGGQLYQVFSKIEKNNPEVLTKKEIRKNQ